MSSTLAHLYPGNPVLWAAPQTAPVRVTVPAKQAALESPNEQHSRDRSREAASRLLPDNIGQPIVKRQRGWSRLKVAVIPRSRCLVPRIGHTASR
jgi:hypothetical protein